MLINATVSAAAGDVAETFTGTSVSHTEATVTWNFNSTVTYGYYANGEPFVVSGGSDIVITSISPAGGTDAGGATNGTVVDPWVVGGEPFDGELSSYNATGNVDPDKTGTDLTISAATYPNGVSVVKGVSLAYGIRSSQSYMEYYSILTVVPSVPAMLKPFRPPVVGTDKTSYFKQADIDMTKLKSLTPVTGADVLADRDRFVGANTVSWKSGGQSAFRDMQPSGFNNAYTNTHKKEITKMMMILHSDISSASKLPLTTALVQAGIDYCAGADAGVEYSSDSAHNDSYKCQAVLAAVMLDSASLTTSSQIVGAFAEDSYLVTVSAGDAADDYLYVNAGNQQPGVGSFYNALQIGWDDWRLDELRPSPVVGVSYRPLWYDMTPCLALTFEMLGTSQEARTVWNNESLFGYSWRCYNWFLVDPSPTGSAGPDAPMMLFMTTHWTTYSASSAALLPEAPVDLTVTANGSELDFAVVNNILIGTGTYSQTDLRYSTDLTNWTTVTNVGNSGTTSGLSANTYYYVQIRFVSTAGTGPWSTNHFFNSNDDIVAYPGVGLAFTDPGYGARLDEIRNLNAGDEAIAAALVRGIATTGA